MTQCDSCFASGTEFCGDDFCFGDKTKLEKEISRRLQDVERQHAEIKAQKEFIEGRKFELEELLAEIRMG